MDQAGRRLQETPLRGDLADYHLVLVLSHKGRISLSWLVKRLGTGALYSTDYLRNPSVFSRRQFRQVLKAACSNSRRGQAMR
jgi:hypothetical protein